MGHIEGGPKTLVDEYLDKVSSEILSDQKMRKKLFWGRNMKMHKILFLGEKYENAQHFRT